MSLPMSVFRDLSASFCSDGIAVSTLRASVSGTMLIDAMTPWLFRPLAAAADDDHGAVGLESDLAGEVTEQFSAGAQSLSPENDQSR